jgi:hypothetical protein
MAPDRTANVQFNEERFPPHDPLHGTADTMVRRTIEFELPEGTSRWEQSDYGHPGRFNDWEPRGIDARLQSKTAALKSAAEAIGALLA